MDDERRGDAERDPRADHAVVLGDRQRLVRDEQDAEPDERQPDQHPRPQRAHEHRRERDLHEVEERERVVRPAGQVQKAREDGDVDHHHERDLPLVDRPRLRAAAPAVTEEVELDPQVGDEPDADHREQRRDRQRAAEQELPGEHGHRLPRHLGPAQSREPLDVDPVSLGDRAARSRRATLAERIAVRPGRVEQAYCFGVSSVLRPLTITFW